MTTAGESRAAAPPECLDDDPPVGRCADPLGPPRVSCFDPVDVALDLTRTRDTSILLVEDPGGGIRAVSEVDVLRRLADTRPDHRVRPGDPIGRLARPVLRLDPGLRRAAAVRRMLEHGTGIAVVATDEGVVGFVSTDSMLRSLVGAAPAIRAPGPRSPRDAAGGRAPGRSTARPRRAVPRRPR